MAEEGLMFDRFDNRVTFSGTLTTLTAMRIGAGRATGVTGTDLPVVRDVLGCPYIPGSSFKGALRSQVESIMRTLSARGACDPLSDPCVSADQMKKWQQERRADGISDKQLAGRVYDASCDVCRVFGSNWLASKVSLRDLRVKKGIWFDQYQIRNGVAIDRDTGTAAEKKLYDFEVVPAATEFECEIVVENASDPELGLLALALRPFERGEGTLGGARSRGLGVVKIAWHKRTRVTSADLFDFLAGEGDAKEIGDADVKDWLKGMRDRLNANSNVKEDSDAKGESNA
ncbi:MAG: CRISPR-associated RAMP protein [Acidobacteria bacterium]|nr:CRISPR-associated RAMP protein [Acidobacteriota bacterium]